MWTEADKKRLLAKAPRFKADWEKISATLFDGKYDPRECCNQYKLLTQTPWTHEDDLKLVALRNIHHPLWGNISLLLGNGHSAASCERRYKHLIGAQVVQPQGPQQ